MSTLQNQINGKYPNELLSGSNANSEEGNRATLAIDFKSLQINHRKLGQVSLGDASIILFAGTCILSLVGIFLISQYFCRRSINEPQVARQSVTSAKHDDIFDEGSIVDFYEDVTYLNYKVGNIGGNASVTSVSSTSSESGHFVTRNISITRGINDTGADDGSESILPPMDQDDEQRDDLEDTEVESILSSYGNDSKPVHQASFSGTTELTDDNRVAHDTPLSALVQSQLPQRSHERRELTLSPCSSLTSVSDNSGLSLVYHSDIREAIKEDERDGPDGNSTTSSHADAEQAQPTSPTSVTSMSGGDLVEIRNFVVRDVCFMPVLHNKGIVGLGLEDAISPSAYPRVSKVDDKSTIVGSIFSSDYITRVNDVSTMGHSSSDVLKLVEGCTPCNDTVDNNGDDEKDKQALQSHDRSHAMLKSMVKLTIVSKELSKEDNSREESAHHRDQTSVAITSKEEFVEV